MAKFSNLSSVRARVKKPEWSSIILNTAASRPILSTKSQSEFLGFFKKFNIFNKVWVPYLGGIFEMRMDKILSILSSRALYSLNISWNYNHDENVCTAGQSV